MGPNARSRASDSRAASRHDSSCRLVGAGSPVWISVARNAALGTQHQPALASVDDHRLVPGRVARRGDEMDALGDLFVAVDEPQPVWRDRRPLGDGVPRPLRFGVLRRLDEHRGVDQPLLAAMVEVEMGEHDRGDVADLEIHRRQRIPECHDLRAVPVVDHGVVLADACVDEDHTVGMTNRPRIDRERFERAVLGVPFRHPGHPRERQSFDVRQFCQRHGPTVG